MCTLTIRRQNNALLVTMNRDEQRARAPEKKPFLWESPQIFAPQDTKANGTWIGVNRQGHVAALLNGYQSSDNNQATQTRGNLVPLVLSGQKIDPTHYASFHLVEIMTEQIKHSHWDGQNFEQTILPNQKWHFLTSSSWKQGEVKTARQNQFEEWIKHGAPIKENLPDIHIEQESESAAHCILMSRNDACTKSITQFEVSEEHLRCRYWPDPHKSTNFEEYQGLF